MANHELDKLGVAYLWIYHESKDQFGDVVDLLRHLSELA